MSIIATAHVLDSFVRVQFVDKHWQDAIKWRILYFARTRKGVDGHTILVQDIPGTAQGTIMGRVFDVCCF
jgi:hypothetical protein